MTQQHSFQWSITVVAKFQEWKPCPNSYFLFVSYLVDWMHDLQPSDNFSQITPVPHYFKNTSSGATLCFTVDKDFMQVSLIHWNDKFHNSIWDKNKNMWVQWSSCKISQVGFGVGIYETEGWVYLYTTNQRAIKLDYPKPTSANRIMIGLQNAPKVRSTRRCSTDIPILALHNSNPIQSYR